jgi:hypothetical protein
MPAQAAGSDEGKKNFKSFCDNRWVKEIYDNNQLLGSK